MRGSPPAHPLSQDHDARVPQAGQPHRMVKKIKREPAEDEEEEDMKGGDDTEEGVEGDTEDGDKDIVVERRRSERRRSGEKGRGEEPEGEGDQEAGSAGNDGTFEDMYSRVKRKRTRRSIYDSAMLNRRRQRERKCIQRQENSSEDSESSSEDDQPPRERKLERVEKRKYHLRETKPTVKRFQISHVEEPPRRSSRTIRAVLCSTRRRHRRRSSSSTSSSSREQRFDRKKQKLTKGRSRLPQLLAGEEADRRGKPEGGGRLADVDPVSLDTSIRFSHVGGLEEHVKCLQEMVVFPMLYAEVFRKYHVTPPKGVLFHGPPGTGKTLIARALANECSQGERKVTFFMRKGADCLSKWVGESERQLRLLFEEAHQARPSIIFFDELDGLAPVRSAKQDQIHASIVSTLLALMDGLDDRGEIIVIGATNRVDAIDPALRRPGRFDRELLFPLPANKERQEILKIHVSKWEKPPPASLIGHLAEKSVGYCGSDLRALCSEAVIQALRRRYPQIYSSSRKLLLDPDNVKVNSIQGVSINHSNVCENQRIYYSFSFQFF
ncbi:ATPase AAA domain-containing protein 2 [Homalodisca vitripennis]|nr:ATPase AAA domain-containing protein 2 [Homalodisca vitripennis]